MSANNGIYILYTKKDKQFRVGHVMNPDRLYDDYTNDNYSDKIVPQRLLGQFVSVRYTKNHEIAFSIAEGMKNNTRVCEYGIVLLSVNYSWSEIVNQSKINLHKEVEHLETKDTDLYNWRIELTKQLIEVLNKMQ